VLEGYVESRANHGTVVSHTLPERPFDGLDGSGTSVADGGDACSAGV
jgi:hypothetical protein